MSTDAVEILLSVFAHGSVIEHNNVFVSYYAGKTGKTAWNMNTNSYHVGSRKARVLKGVKEFWLTASKP